MHHWLSLTRRAPNWPRAQTQNNKMANAITIDALQKELDSGDRQILAGIVSNISPSNFPWHMARSDIAVTLIGFFLETFPGLQGRETEIGQFFRVSTQERNKQIIFNATPTLSGKLLEKAATFIECEDGAKRRELLLRHRGDLTAASAEVVPPAHHELATSVAASLDVDVDTAARAAHDF